MPVSPPSIVPAFKTNAALRTLTQIGWMRRSISHSPFSLLRLLDQLDVVDLEGSITRFTQLTPEAREVIREEQRGIN
jgi:hypothetical protein